MSLLRNKHVVTAMIIAPLLAVVSYYLVDLSVKEHPQKAVSGKSYRLVAKSNCRYSSGACDLENGSFASRITVSRDGDSQTLRIDASHPLQTASIGFMTPTGEELGPIKLSRADDSALAWGIELIEPANGDALLRVAITANGAHYFAETTMAFSHYQTSFEKDFRQ